MNDSVRPAESVEAMVHRHGDMLYRIALVMLGNRSDAEDAVQETAIKYVQKAPDFRDAEHEKAWLIRVLSNQCRDVQRFWKRHPQMDLDALRESAPAQEDHSMLEALMAVPEKFRMVLILHYVEEYKINEIAEMTDKSASAVKMRLQKGRKLLAEAYRREDI